MIDPVIFRRYDIRGVVGRNFQIEDSYMLGRAIITLYKKIDPTLTTIVIGRDGRVHARQIREQIIAAARDENINVIDLGICPTPVFYFALHTGAVDSGIMITASHNPGEYNGFKLCCKKRTVWGEQLQEIYQVLNAVPSPFLSDEGEAKSIQIHLVDTIPTYVAWLVEHFPFLRNMPLRVMVDCGNGTAGLVYKALIAAMKWEHVSLLYDEVDGRFPHHEADPTQQKNMRVLASIMRQQGHDVGIGFDGDCDRMAPMSQKGEVIGGDMLLALFGREVVRENPHAGIVYDVKSSKSLITVLDQVQATGYISACGHALIKESMRENGALLGGELSCHFFFKDRYFGYDDGIYASLRLYEILMQSDKSIDMLIAELPQQISSPEFRLPCTEEIKGDIIAAVATAFQERKNVDLITIDGVRAQMPYGWGLVRASNTQPEISIRFESDTIQGFEQLKADFTLILQPYLDVTVIHEISE